MIKESGHVVDQEGRTVGNIEEVKNLKSLVGKGVNSSGSITSSSGDVLGQAKMEAEVEGNTQYTTTKVEGKDRSEGHISQFEDPKEVGEAETEQVQHVERAKEVETELPLDYRTLLGTKGTEMGDLVDDDDDIIGLIIEGEPKELQGMKSDENGDIWNDSGEKVGKGKPFPDSELQDNQDAAPFKNFPNAVVETDGTVTADGQQIGTIVDGDPDLLKGSAVDADGSVLDSEGNIIGKAVSRDEFEPEPEFNNTILDGKRVNLTSLLVARSRCNERTNT